MWKYFLNNRSGRRAYWPKSANRFLFISKSNCDAPPVENFVFIIMLSIKKSSNWCAINLKAMLNIFIESSVSRLCKLVTISCCAHTRQRRRRRPQKNEIHVKWEEKKKQNKYLINKNCGSKNIHDPNEKMFSLWIRVHSRWVQFGVERFTQTQLIIRQKPDYRLCKAPSRKWTMRFFVHTRIPENEEEAAITAFADKKVNEPETFRQPSQTI